MSGALKKAIKEFNGVRGDARSFDRRDARRDVHVLVFEVLGVLVFEVLGVLGMHVDGLFARG